MTTLADRQETGTAEPSGSAVVHITYYTDPLCCWSWGFEPQWRLLRSVHAGRIAWRLRMGGMIGDWESFDDPVNSIHRPGQMGPLWMEAERLTGMPMNSGLWRNDPPASSWPACRAFKAAEFQSAFAGDLFLRRMREAAMLEEQNIARTEILFALAQDCARAFPDRFDAERFAADLDSAAAYKALREDMREARVLGISRFPALVLQRTGGPPRFVIGWRPYAILRSALAEIAPELNGAEPTESFAAATARWPSMTPREIEEFRTVWPEVSAASGTG